MQRQPVTPSASSPQGRVAPRRRQEGCREDSTAPSQGSHVAAPGRPAKVATGHGSHTAPPGEGCRGLGTGELKGGPVLCGPHCVCLGPEAPGIGELYSNRLHNKCLIWPTRYLH